MRLSKGAGILGAGVSGAILSVVWLVVSGVTYWEKSQRLTQQHCDLAELSAAQPFPSEENVKRMEANLSRFEYQIGELAALLVQDPFPGAVEDAAAFSARAQSAIERIQQQAAAAGVSLPSSMEAGFVSYASGGAVPLLEHVPRLCRQLYSVEKVAEVLLAGEVASIEALSRDQFELPHAIERLPTVRRRGQEIIKEERAQVEKTAADGCVGCDGLYSVERVGATFVAREKAAWRVLGLLASSPHFMVLADFRHETETTIPTYSPIAMKRGEYGEGEMAKFLSEGVLVGESALPRQDRIIAGNEMVRIQIVVEVYNFEADLEQEWLNEGD